MGFWTVFAIVLSAASFTASYVQAKKAQKRAKRLADEMAGVLLNKESNIEAIPVVYGERRVGGVRVFMSTSGSDRNEYLYVALVVSEGEVEQISDLEIDEVPATDSRFQGLVSYDYELGTDDQTTNSVLDDALITVDDSDPNWEYQGIVVTNQAFVDDFRLRGVAYVAIRLKYDAEVFNGVPDFTVKVKGRKVYDARKDSTSTHYDSSLGVSTHREATTSTWEWTDNPALCLRDYLTNDRFGKGLSSSDLDEAEFVQAADDLDSFTVTPYSGSSSGHKLFRLNAVIDTNEEIFTNVEKILLSCRGFLPYTFGKYGLKIDQASISVMTLDTSTIIGDINIVGSRKEDRFNQVIVKFPDANTRFQPNNAVWPNQSSTNPTLVSDGGSGYLTEAELHDEFLADDDELLLDEVDLEYCTDYYAARDLARILLWRSRTAINVALQATSEAMELTVGDVVRITHPTPNWTAKKFQVDEMSINYDGTVTLKCVEYDNTIYTYDPAAEEIEAIDIIRGDPGNVQAPTNVTGTNTGSALLADGTFHAVLNVSWTASLDATVIEYEVRYKLDSQTPYKYLKTTDTTVRIEGMAPGTYNIAVRALDAFGGKSAFTTGSNVNTGIDNTIPGDVTNTGVTAGIGNLVASWANPNDTDLKQIRVYVATTNTQPTNPTAVVTGEAYTVTNIVGSTDAARKRYFWLQAEDYSGNVGNTTSSFSGIANQATGDDIGDGEVDTGQIADEAVDITKIDNTLQSTNYAQGSAGWKLTKDGTFEAGDGDFRGTIKATVLDVEDANVHGTLTATNISAGIVTAESLAADVFAEFDDRYGGSGGFYRADNDEFFDGSATKYVTLTTVTHDSAKSIRFQCNLVHSWGTTSGYGGTNGLKLRVTFEYSTNNTTWAKVPGSGENSNDYYERSATATIYSVTSAFDLAADIRYEMTGSSLSDNTAYYFRVKIEYVSATNAFTSAAAGSANGVPIKFNAQQTAGLTAAAGDADTVDGLQASQFLRSDTSDTFSGNLTVTGSLTVQGSQTQLDTQTLTVEDNNIVLNHSTGDSSGSADDSGITIQDAVNSSTDASILWKATGDYFQFSHPINAISSASNAYAAEFRGAPQPFGSSGVVSNGVKITAGSSSNDTVLLVQELDNTAILTINGFGQTTFANSVTIDGESVTGTKIGQWDTAYTYSQVGHLPLSGGALTGNLTIPVSNKLYFGGSNHTYITEDTDDRLRFFTGGAEFMRFTESTADTINFYQKIAQTPPANTNESWKLTVADNIANQAFTAMLLDYNISGSDALVDGEEEINRAHKGFLIDVDSSATGGTISAEHRVYGQQINVRCTGDSDVIYGLHNVAEAQQTAGQVTHLYGIFSEARGDVTSGTLSNQYGVYGYSSLGNATGSVISNAYGGFFKTASLGSQDSNINKMVAVYAEAEVAISSASTTVSTAMCVEAQFDNNSGGDVTITNGYLFYGNYAGTLPTTAYGVYIADTVPNRFNGSIETGLGSTTTASYGFNGDINTGMYSPANHEVAFLANGQQKLKVSGTGVDVTGTITSSGKGTFANLRLTGTTDHLDITEASGDWLINNAQQGNGIKIYDGTSGVHIHYNALPLARFSDTGVHIGDAVAINSYGELQVNQTVNNDESGIAVLDSTNSRSMRLWCDTTTAYINSGNGGSGDLKLNEAVTISSTGNITTSGNLTVQGEYTGTVSFSSITTSGILDFTANPAYIRNNEDNSGQIIISAKNASGVATQVRWDVANDSAGAFRPDVTGSSNLGLTNRVWDTLYVNNIRLGSGNTLFVDESRNVTAGAITSSGRIDITTNSSVSEPYAAFGITQTSLTSSAGLFLNPAGGRKYEIQATAGNELIFYDRASSAYRLRIMANGNLKIEGGNLQMSGTTVIDSLRNLTNIGTGTFGTQVALAKLGTATSSSAQFSSASVAFEASGWDVNNAFARTGVWTIKNVPTASNFPDFDLNFYEEGNGLKFQLHGRGSNTYVDPLAASFYGDVNINAYSASSTDGGDGNLTVAGAIGAGGAAEGFYDLKVYGLARFQGAANFVSATNPIQVGGLTIVDASRNLTNIGTISSGAITSSGTITTSGSFVGVNAIVDNVIAKTSGGNILFKTNGGSSIARFNNNQSADFFGAINSSGLIKGTRSITSADVDYLRLQMSSWSQHAGYLKSLVWHDGANNIAGIGAEYDQSKTNIHFHSQYNAGYKGTSVKTFSVFGNGNVDVLGTTLSVGNSTGGNQFFKRPSANYIFADQTGGYLVFGTNGLSTSLSNASLTLDASKNATFGGTINSGAITSSGIVDAPYFIGGSGAYRVKFSVWTGTTYGIGMKTGFTYGGLGNQYAMCFQMNSTATRGWWWGNNIQTDAQGAMALTTEGKMTVSHSMRLGYGANDTTTPGATHALDVSGSIYASSDIYADGGNLIIGDDAFSNDGNYVGLKTSAMTGAYDYMIISAPNDGNTYISAKNGNSVYIRGGGNLASNEIRVPDSTFIQVDTNNFNVEGNITAFHSSDESLKENIRVIDSPIEKIKQIRGVYFDWTDDYIKQQSGDGQIDIRKSDIGVIAQDVQPVLDEVVTTRKDGTMAVRYEKMIALCIEAIKDQQDQIDLLKDIIEDMKNGNN